MSGYGLIDFAQIFSDWVHGLSEIWYYLTTTEILGVDLIVILLGGGISVYMTLVIAKWILDFVN